MLGTEGYAISAYTTDEEAAAAVEFLRFFVEHDDQMMFWQSSGKIPATVEGQKAEYITGDDYAGYLQRSKMAVVHSKLCRHKWIKERIG